MKKQLAFNTTFLILLLMGVAGCGNDQPLSEPTKPQIAASADSAPRAQLADLILDVWVLNGRPSRNKNKLDSAGMEGLKQMHLWGEKIIRDSMEKYQTKYGFAWQPPAYYLDSSDKPLAFYQRPLTPEELSEQRAAEEAGEKAAHQPLKSDKKLTPTP